MQVAGSKSPRLLEYRSGERIIAEGDYIAVILLAVSPLTNVRSFNHYLIEYNRIGDCRRLDKIWYTSLELGFCRRGEVHCLAILRHTGELAKLVFIAKGFLKLLVGKAPRQRDGIPLVGRELPP